MATGTAPKFDETKITEYFQAGPPYGHLVILKNQEFEKSKDESSDIFLIEFSSQKMILEKDLKLQAKKIYRVIFPGTLNSFESYQLVVFSSLPEGGPHIDSVGEKYSDCENTLNSILVAFNEDINVKTIVVWINRED